MTSWSCSNDGHDFGVDLTYRYQRGAMGIAHAIGLARDFVGSDPFCAPGDNILRGQPALDAAMSSRPALGGRDAALQGPRCPPLRRGGTLARHLGSGGGLRGEAGGAQERLDPHRRLLLRPDAFDVIAHLEPSGR